MEDTKTASVHEPELKHHFDDMGQQHEAATLGMWLFLATEVLFFGGLFTAYMIYRVWYPGTFGDASGVTPSVPWIVLVASGLGTPGSYPIALRVTDSFGLSSTFAK